MATKRRAKPLPAPLPEGITQRIGRSRKGSPNKTTKNAREAIARFVDGNCERLQEWLDQIAENEGPLMAFRCVTDLLEYHVPKLARTEHSGIDGGDIPVGVTVRFVAPVKE